MPEMRFNIRWPDDSAEQCYSPSLVVKDFFAPGQSYALVDFRARAHSALSIASDRVKARYGVPCSLALAQLTRIEAGCDRYLHVTDARVRVESFEE